MNQRNPNHSGKDPVCGAILDTSLTNITHRYHRRVFHFCSAQCRNEFMEDPQRYLATRRHRKLPPRMRLPISRMRCFHA